MKTRILAPLFLLLASACAAPGGPAGKVLSSTCPSCGTVRGIDVINTGDAGRTSGAGALMGAVVGGVVGHQFGSGRGQDAATAAGAVGGAVAGNEMERQRNANAVGRYYRVTIDMDRGDTASINVDNPAALRSGDRVRVVGNNIEIIQ
jgi:outer membrane lipoprotein SlyB